MFLDALDSSQGIGHTPLGFKLKRLRHHAHGENAHLLGQPGHYIIVEIDREVGVKRFKGGDTCAGD